MHSSEASSPKVQNYFINNKFSFIVFDNSNGLYSWSDPVLDPSEGYATPHNTPKKVE
jgi:hypothetical protein